GRTPGRCLRRSLRPLRGGRASRRAPRRRAIPPSSRSLPGAMPESATLGSPDGGSWVPPGTELRRNNTGAHGGDRRHSGLGHSVTSRRWDILFPSREDWTRPDSGYIGSPDSEIREAPTVFALHDLLEAALTSADPLINARPRRTNANRI